MHRSSHACVSTVFSLCSACLAYCSGPSSSSPFSPSVSHTPQPHHSPLRLSLILATCSIAQRSAVEPFAHVLLLLCVSLWVRGVRCAVSHPLRVSAQDEDVDEVSEDDFEVEDEGEEEEVLEEEEDLLQPRILGPHSAVSTFIHFPDYPTTHRFTQGEDVVALIGVSNRSPSTYFNVSYIGAQLHSPFDFSYYIQNFTVRETESIVGPGQETTVEYRFRPDPSLEPIEFQLSVWAIYNSSEGRMYQSTAFNDTVELVEKREPWTVASAINYALVLAGLGVMGYVGWNLTQGTGGKKKKRVKRTEGDAVAPAKWETTAYQPAAKARVVRKPGSKKGSKKKSSDSTKADTQQTD